MTVGIIGCGWLGKKIAETICKEYSVHTTTTSQERFGELQAKGFNPTVVTFSDEVDSPSPRLWELAASFNVVIITVPFSDRLSSFEAQSARMANLSSFLGNFKGQLFFMSTTSVYPDIPNEFIEDNVPSENVPAERLIRNRYPRVNILRLAGLMGGSRLLKNYKVSNLDMPVNHVHYADVCAVVKRMIELRLASKLYNVVAPMHPTKEEVISSQEGAEVANGISTAGRIISGRKLMSELDYEFIYPDPRWFHLLS